MDNKIDKFLNERIKNSDLQYSVKKDYIVFNCKDSNAFHYEFFTDLNVIKPIKFIHFVGNYCVIAFDLQGIKSDYSEDFIFVKK